MNRHTVQKRVRGLRYGALVGRTENLRIPKSVLIGTRRHRMSLPEERGVRTDFAEILLSDIYGLERRGRDVFSTVLDIGANVGLFALAARKIHRHALIHTYEPNTALEPYLTVQLAAARHFVPRGRRSRGRPRKARHRPR